MAKEKIVEGGIDKVWMMLVDDKHVLTWERWWGFAR